MVPLLKKSMGAVLVLTVVLSLGALAGAEPVSMGYVMWDSEIASHAVLAAIIESHITYPKIGRAHV